VLRALRQRRRKALVRALSDPHSRHGPPTRQLLPCGRSALDVVLDAAELERPVAVAQRVRGTRVTVERHTRTARIEQRRPVRTRPLELQMAVAEDNGLVADAVQHALVVVPRLCRKAVDVRERRAVDVENSVQLGLRLERAEPALLAAEASVARCDAPGAIGPVARRLP